MVDLNRIILSGLVMCGFILNSCKNKPTKDKRYISSIEFLSFEDIDLNNPDTILVKTFVFDLKDTNKYALMRIQIANNYHFSSKQMMSQWAPAPGYRGPSDRIISISFNGKKGLFVSQKDLIFHRKFHLDSKNNNQIIYSLDDLIYEYDKARKSNESFFPSDNLYLVVYKDSLREILSKKAVLRLITDRKTIYKTVKK